jgi:hypothetical protein
MHTLCLFHVMPSIGNGDRYLGPAVLLELLRLIDSRDEAVIA